MWPQKNLFCFPKILFQIDARNYNLKVKVSFLAFYFNNPVQKKFDNYIGHLRERKYSRNFSWKIEKIITYPAADT